jgi:hypothetical protein
VVTFAGDFWPLFATIVGVAVGLTVLLTTLIAKFPARRQEPVPVPVELAPAWSSEHERHAQAA